MTETIDLGIDGLSECREIGSGGFATVYSAFEAGQGRRVAVKVLTAIDDAGRRRFDRERLTMGQTTDHTNVVTLFRSGYTIPDNKPYLVMEYLAGGSLQDRLDTGGPNSWDEAIGLILPIADALAYSHRAGIVHKDVKPANILISSTEVVKLADFGIAAMKEATVISQVAYSLAYTPPETFDAHRDPATGELVDPRDERSDLYSLAGTLFALGTGVPPFRHPTQAGLISQIHNEPLDRTGHRRLDEFLATAMAKDPEDRYSTAGDFIDHLQVVGQPSVTAIAGLADPVRELPVLNPIGSSPSEPHEPNRPPLIDDGSSPSVSDRIRPVERLAPTLPKPHHGPNKTGNRWRWAWVGVVAATAIVVGLVLATRQGNDGFAEPGKVETDELAQVTDASGPDTESTLVAAAREWRTLLATEMTDPLTLGEPIEGPAGKPLALSAADETVRIWSYGDDWSVAQTVDLVGSFILDVEQVLPGADSVVVDGVGNQARLIIPTAYANGPAVAAVGYDGTTWELLKFEYPDAWCATGEPDCPQAVESWFHAADGQIVGGEIIVWYTDCSHSCADGEPLALGVERINHGYLVDDPPQRLGPIPGESCVPGSSPDCTNVGSVDLQWRYIEGYADCAITFGEAGLCTDLDGDGLAGYPDSG